MHYLTTTFFQIFRAFAGLRIFQMAGAKRPVLENEKEFVQQAQQGDENAFARLYDHYFPQIYRYLYRRCGHQETTEDLTSQVFLKAFKKLPSYHITGAPFGAWVYRIASNALTDYYRSSAHNKEQLHDVMPEREDEYRTAHEEVISSEEKDQVLGFIARLSDKDQKIVQLRFLAELSVKEIAETVKMTPNAVSVRIFRSLKQLKQIAEQERGIV